jgi:hypothetical protein
MVCTRLPIRLRSMGVISLLVLGLLVAAPVGTAKAAHRGDGSYLHDQYNCRESLPLGRLRKVDFSVYRSSGCSTRIYYSTHLVRKEGLWPYLDQSSGYVYPGSRIYFGLWGSCKSGTHPYMGYFTYPIYDDGGTANITC